MGRGGCGNVRRCRHATYRRARASAPSGNRWVLGARPRTLPAAVVPVALGAGVAVGSATRCGGGRVLALVVSLALQVGVNYANDYSDGVRGTDEVRVGPVRLVAGKLASPAAVKRAALLAFGVAARRRAGAGDRDDLVAAARRRGWRSLAAWGYTGGPKPYGYLGLGEVFVFVFFGLVATVGTTYVVSEELPSLAWIAGCIAGCLACALLVVNNLRDIPTDRVAGKRTLAVRLGDAPHPAALPGSAGRGVRARRRRRRAAPAGAASASLGIVAAVPPVRTIRSGRHGTAT